MNRIKDWLLDFTWDDALGFAGAILTIAIVVGLFLYTNGLITASRGAVEERFASCIYLGSRVSDTRRQATVYRYHCGYTSTGKRVVEETTRRFN